jgi:hypothetical protein
VLPLFSFALVRVLVQALQDGKQVRLSLLFELREIREIRTNLYSTGFQETLFENFYHIDSRSFAYLKGTGFLDNLLEIHNTGLLPLHRVE